MQDLTFQMELDYTHRRNMGTETCLILRRRFFYVASKSNAFGTPLVSSLKLIPKVSVK